MECYYNLHISRTDKCQPTIETEYSSYNLTSDYKSKNWTSLDQDIHDSVYGIVTIYLRKPGKFYFWLYYPNNDKIIGLIADYYRKLFEFVLKESITFFILKVDSTQIWCLNLRITIFCAVQIRKSFSKMLWISQPYQITLPLNPT